MVYVFSDSEKEAARRTKNKLFWGWFAGLMGVLLVVGAAVGVNIWLVEQLRVRSYTFLIGFLSALITLGYAFFSLFFFSIKYRLTRKYVRMLRDIDHGLKDTIEAKFMGYDDTIGMKDGVYFYSMILKTKPLRRDDIDERKLLVEHTIPKIELAEGARLRLISHANILVAYEILDNPLLEIAEPPSPQAQDTQQQAEQEESKQ